MRRERVVLLILLAALGGCALQPVQPWQRKHLAQWDMQWDPDPLQRAQADHAHFSKEGSAGSVGAAGGGCGCN
jgi:hypothetical protein